MYHHFQNGILFLVDHDYTKKVHSNHHPHASLFANMLKPPLILESQMVLLSTFHHLDNQLLSDEIGKSYQALFFWVVYKEYMHPKSLKTFLPLSLTHMAT